MWMCAVVMATIEKALEPCSWGFICSVISCLLITLISDKKTNPEMIALYFLSFFLDV